MKTNVSFSRPAEVETECLVVVALDRGVKDKNQVTLESTDVAVKFGAAGVLSTGEVSGKIFETTQVRDPAKLKAKRLLLMGGEKAKNFSAYELRSLAEAAVR